MSDIQDMENVNNACNLLRQVKDSGGALLVLTGAGMSVSSGVPVFRNSDGSMSPEFMAFLEGFNKVRRKHNLSEADDWFNFSVAEMFRPETEVEAWHYWRWRVLRARVEPAEDYAMLNRLAQYFGNGRVFVKTSNCDMLHVLSGTNPSQIVEIHGSLGTLQCSRPCSNNLYPVDDSFLEKLSDPNDPNWVPKCPKCNVACLRPNVMIFNDYALVESKLEEQEQQYRNFCNKFPNNFVALEVGAGSVVSSIRFEAEAMVRQGKGLIRVNPSQDECRDCSVDSSKYVPLVSKSGEALRQLCNGLGLV